MPDQITLDVIVRAWGLEDTHRRLVQLGLARRA